MPSTKQPVKVAQLVGIRGTIMKYSVYRKAPSGQGKHQSEGPHGSVF
jgi:hypothetical protein